MATFVPPKFRKYFEPNLSPHAEVAERAALQWARDMGLVCSADAEERWRNAENGVLAGYVAPLASAEMVTILAQWGGLLFVLDDQYAEGRYTSAEGWRSAILHLHRVMETAKVDPDEDSPAARALADLVGRLYPRVRSAWRRRFAKHAWESFDAATAENAYRSLNRPPGINEFVALRRPASAMLPHLDVTELASGSDLPPEIYDLEALQELILATTDIVAWSNDVASLEKEEACGEKCNFVLVLEHAEGLSREAAIDAVLGRVSERVEQYVETERVVKHLIRREPREIREQVDYVMHGFRSWIGGQEVWHEKAERFRSAAAGGTVEHITPLVFAADPGALAT